MKTPVVAFPLPAVLRLSEYEYDVRCAECGERYLVGGWGIRPDDLCLTCLRGSAA